MGMMLYMMELKRREQEKNEKAVLPAKTVEEKAEMPSEEKPKKAAPRTSKPAVRKRTAKK